MNPENFLRNAKQEFPCQGLESFSGEYYTMENKILDFQFGPAFANQTCPNTVLEASKMKEKSSVTDRVHQNVKRYINQLRMRVLSRNSGS